MPPVFIVKGYVSLNKKEKQTFYVGGSPTIAFKYFYDYSLNAEMVIEIWEDGCLVNTIKQEHYTVI